MLPRQSSALNETRKSQGNCTNICYCVLSPVKSTFCPGERAGGWARGGVTARQLASRKKQHEQAHQPLTCCGCETSTCEVYAARSAPSYLHTTFRMSGGGVQGKKSPPTPPPAFPRAIPWQRTGSRPTWLSGIWYWAYFTHAQRAHPLPPLSPHTGGEEETTDGHRK
jgi:hypothetical protein